MKRLLKQALGRLLACARPDLVRRVMAHGVESYDWNMRDVSLAERLVAEAVARRHESTGTVDKLAEAHKSFWASEQATAFHEESRRRFEEAFLGTHRMFVDALMPILRSGRYRALCEIGCGAGHIVNYMAAELPALREFVGIDLSPKQAALNQQRATDPRVRFVAADAAPWVAEHTTPGTAFITYGGVLEYFTEQTLASTLRLLASRAPVCFAMVEPVAPDHDLAADSRSHVFGGEMSFSHNYRHAFEAAGFTVDWQHELPLGRWLMLIATKGG